MRPTINVTFRDRMKHHTNSKEQLNKKRKQKRAQKYPPTHGPYSVEQTQQGTHSPKIAEA